MCIRDRYRPEGIQPREVSGVEGHENHMASCYDTFQGVGKKGYSGARSVMAYVTTKLKEMKRNPKSEARHHLKRS